MAASGGFFAASDGVKLYTRRHDPPEGTPLRALVHIVHGLGEHVGRYDRFAERLAAEGLAVVAHDARGHGMTATAPEGGGRLGLVPAGPEGAVPRMVADLAELLVASRKQHPALPIILFGHSFGTVVSQLCCGAGAGGVRLAGLVLSAPPARFPGFLAPPFRVLIAALRSVHGEDGFSKVPAKLTFVQLQAKIVKAVAIEEGKATGWDWLNRDKAEVQKYIEDPMCGFDMAVGFWSSVVPSATRLKSPDAHRKLQQDLPILVIAGEQDFCMFNDFGVASYTQIQQEMTAAGKPSPKIIVYPKARHELLLETNREEVTEDLVAFMHRCLQAVPRSAL